MASASASTSTPSQSQSQPPSEVMTVIPSKRSSEQDEDQDEGTKEDSSSSSLSSKKFPCVLTMDFPLPDHRLASTAQRALQVDAELSPLVQRTFSLVSPSMSSTLSTLPSSTVATTTADEAENLSVLRVEYRATTNRMLRVAVNGFMESLAVVLHIMQDLDVDVLEAESGHHPAQAHAQV